MRTLTEGVFAQKAATLVADALCVVSPDDANWGVRRIDREAMQPTLTVTLEDGRRFSVTVAALDADFPRPHGVERPESARPTVGETRLKGMHDIRAGGRSVVVGRCVCGVMLNRSHVSKYQTTCLCGARWNHAGYLISE